MRFFLITALCVFAMASSVYAFDHVATVKEISGDVAIDRGGKTLSPSIGEKLYNGDIVRTQKDASAGFTFIDGTRIGMGESSDFTVSHYEFTPLEKNYAFDVFLKKGSAVYSSGKIGKLDPKSVSFHTPKATVGVRGTKFVIKVQ